MRASYCVVIVGADGLVLIYQSITFYIMDS